MRQEEWVRLFRMFPLDKQGVLVLVLGNREEIAIDQVVRFEPTYAVFRGRVAGTDNEGRGFFVPYEHMCYLRIEKVVKLADVQILYGQKPTAAVSEPLVHDENPVEIKPANPVATPAPREAKAGSGTGDVRDKLLRRIRSTRSGDDDDQASGMGSHFG